ncbi:hypothetical protein N7444_003531 [Penicillium canescens]|nr:hypothetical protein N7444_003531 [Penicillium canescens]
MSIRSDGRAPGVMHKQPDHLRKNDRIELLLHIIRELGKDGITADRLKEVAEDNKRSLENTSDVGIFFEILRVRKMEERYGRGEVDRNIPVYVNNHGFSPKRDEVEGSADGANCPILTEGAAGYTEGGLLKLSFSIEQPAAPPTTSIGKMGVPDPSLLGNFTLGEPWVIGLGAGSDKCKWR